MNQYQLCAFADEASPKLAEQIIAMRENNIGYLEMRGVDGVNVAKLTAEQAKAAARDLSAAGIKVWSLGSPAGKSPITQDFAVEREQFLRLLETAQITDAKCIRLFSFYGTDGKPEYRDEVLERLSRFIDLAKGSGVILCHENEKGIYGDNDIRCAEIHRALPELKAVLTPLTSYSARSTRWPHGSCSSPTPITVTSRMRPPTVASCLPERVWDI